MHNFCWPKNARLGEFLFFKRDFYIGRTISKIYRWRFLMLIQSVHVLILNLAIINKIWHNFSVEKIRKLLVWSLMKEIDYIQTQFCLNWNRTQSLATNRSCRCIVKFLTLCKRNPKLGPWESVSLYCRIDLKISLDRN